MWGEKQPYRWKKNPEPYTEELKEKEAGNHTSRGDLHKTFLVKKYQKKKEFPGIAFWPPEFPVYITKKNLVEGVLRGLQTLAHLAGVAYQLGGFEKKG